MENIKKCSKNNELRMFVVLLAAFSVINIFPMRSPVQVKSMAARYGVMQRKLPGKAQLALQELQQGQILEQEWQELDQMWQKEANQKKRGLLIFLADSEINRLVTVGGNLLNALHTEMSPIIVSTALLYTLIEQRKKDTRPINIMMNEFVAAKKMWIRTTDPMLKKDLQQAYYRTEENMVSKIAFKEEQWIIKKINNSLNLLIPRNYLKLLDVDSDKVQECCEYGDSISEIELKLGLKVNHMESITVEQINSRPIYEEFADYFSDSLNSIFCKKSDYKNVMMYRPEWFFYINGHGAINNSIAGCSLNGFKKFLNFLESKIDTHLLWILSCQAIGVNSNIIFGTMKSEIKNQYSFPILIEGVNDTNTTGTFPPINMSAWNKNLKIELAPTVNFAGFLKIAQRIEDIYKEIVPLADLEIENIPQIKLPGIEWFSVLDFGKKVVSIGSTLAKTRDPQQPLNIVNFFKKDPEIILLYTDSIPFELIINSNKLEAIVSMMSSKLLLLPAFVVHKIKKISSNRGFLEILYWFRLVLHTEGSKFFLIDQIGDNKDILIFGTNTESMKVYFRDKDDFLCTAELNRGEEKISIVDRVESNSEDEKKYKNIMLLVERYQQLSAGTKEAKQEITPEQLEKIKNVIIKQYEKQLQEAKK